MKTKPNCPELMFRVKLPEGDFYAGISGGCSEEESIAARPWKDAIFAIKPPWYEVKWPSKGQAWPKDSEGYTWVPLYLTNEKDACGYWMESYWRAHDKLEKVREFMRSVGL